MDSMIDMLGVEEPLKVLMKLKKPPTVVVIHKGRDEENTFALWVYSPGRIDLVAGALCRRYDGIYRLPGKEVRYRL